MTSARGRRSPAASSSSPPQPSESPASRSGKAPQETSRAVSYRTGATWPEGCSLTATKDRFRPGELHPAGLQSESQGRLAQLGEHQLDKLGVTGSSPVPPTIGKPRLGGVFRCADEGRGSRCGCRRGDVGCSEAHLQASGMRSRKTSSMGRALWARSSRSLSAVMFPRRAWASSNSTRSASLSGATPSDGAAGRSASSASRASGALASSSRPRSRQRSIVRRVTPAASAAWAIEPPAASASLAALTAS